MKKQVLSLVGVLSLLLVAGSAMAQNWVVANVPFSFSVNRTTCRRANTGSLASGVATPC